MSITVAGGLKRSGAVLLVSCYELGHQPQAVALPLAFLERAGYAPAALDLAVQSLDMQKIREARFVGISVPMHTALRLGVKVARRIREVNPGCHVCFYGNYALLHAESLLHRLADSILGGEFEARLVELVDALGEGRCLEPGLPARLLPALERLDFPVPSRRALPGIEHYAHLDHGGRHRVAGHVEASRGCLHRCRHCPIPAVYAGRLFVVPRESVLEDVRNQVRSGAAHITFGDADFLNGPSHSLRVVRAMHEEFPDLSFDFTAKVEHVLAHRRLMPELGRLGAVFMVTAVESLSDRVLSILDKRHTRADVFDARAILRDAGIAMR
ncbi:MAG: radical SAM protein, partial [Candidatus Krumholzibacteriia bacterium]